MILKEPKTSSTLKEPQIKSALLDKYDDDHKKEIDGYERLKTKESNKLPQPTGWRLVVLPFKMKEKTKGGLIIGQDTLERQQVGSTCGLVARYAGSRIQIDGGEIRMLNDDEVLATIDNPEDILHQY